MCMKAEMLKKLYEGLNARSKVYFCEMNLSWMDSVNARKLSQITQKVPRFTLELRVFKRSMMSPPQNKEGGCSWRGEEVVV